MNTFFPRTNSGNATTYLRSAIAHALAPEEYHEYARERWGDKFTPVQKALVGSVETDEVSPFISDFADVVLNGSILGALPNLRRVEFRSRFLTMAEGARGYWTKPGDPVPLSKPIIDGATLNPLAVYSLIVVPESMLKEGGPIVEAGLQRDLTRAVSESVDAAFIDPGNSGTADEEPASITSGVTPISATTDPAADIAALIEMFEGDLSEAAFITDPVTAARLALARDAGGAFSFPDVGPRGGSLLGMPVVTSNSSPRDSNGGHLVLVDPTSIAVGLGGIRITNSEVGSVAMRDDPESPSELVSLWQTHSVGLLAAQVANWRVDRAGAVALLSGCDW